MGSEPLTENPPRPIETALEGVGPRVPSGVHWPELDLFRSLACALMVLNHLAVEIPGGRTSWFLSVSELAGGFAPVLFYFATGLGYGIQSTRSGGPRGFGFLVKVAVLLVADLDFFAFIGLSMLLLEGIRRIERGTLVALAVGLAMVLARFAAGPRLRPLIEGHPWGPWVGDVVGTGGHFGYPLGPWLAYPMFGYVLGRLAAKHRESLAGCRWLPLALALASTPFALACLVLVARGNPLFRYGSMNAAYFLASLAVLVGSLGLVTGLTRIRWTSGASRWVSLSGLRSFAVVPIHYVLLALIVAAEGAPALPLSFLATFAVVLGLSFVGSAWFVRLVAPFDRPARRWPAVAAVVGLTIVYYLVLRGSTEGVAAVAVRSSFQLALCLVLALRLATTREGRGSSPVASPA